MKKTNFSNVSASSSSSFSSSLLTPGGKTSDIKKQTVDVYLAMETKKQIFDYWKYLNKSFFSSNDLLKGENTTVQRKENSNEWIPETWRRENDKIILPSLHNDRACFLAHQWHHYCCRCMRINFPSSPTVLASIATNSDNHNNSNNSSPHHYHHQQQQHPSISLYHEASPFLCTDDTAIATVTGLSRPQSHNTYPCRDFEVVDQTLPPPTVLMSSLAETSITSSLVSSKQQQQVNNQNTIYNNNNHDNGNGNGIVMVANTNNTTISTTAMTEPQQGQYRPIPKTARRCFDYTTVYRLHVLLFESVGLDKSSKNVERQKLIEETGLDRSQVNNWISRHNRELKEPIKLYRQLVQKKAIEHSYKSFVSYCREHRVMHELPSDDNDDDDDDDDGTYSSSNGSIQNNSNSNDMDTGD